MRLLRSTTHTGSEGDVKITHVYIGKKPCGCTVAYGADEPMYPRFTARRVEEMIGMGLTVNRITVEEYNAALPIGCKCDQSGSLAVAS